MLRACNPAIGGSVEAVFRLRVGSNKQAAQDLGTALKNVCRASERHTRVADLREFLTQMYQASLSGMSAASSHTVDATSRQETTFDALACLNPVDDPMPERIR